MRPQVDVGRHIGSKVGIPVELEDVQAFLEGVDLSGAQSLGEIFAKHIDRSRASALMASA